MQIRDELAKPTQYSRGRWFIASGEALELWTIKILCGLFFSKIAATTDRQRLVEDHFLNVETFDRAIRGHPLPERCGMWFRPNIGQVPHYIQAAPLTSTRNQRVLGIRNRVFLIEFFSLRLTRLSILPGSGLILQIKGHYFAMAAEI
jgi:hypothetical protein